jgi:FKBP-type peptidyl-prolyl cis-trans isomerase
MRRRLVLLFVPVLLGSVLSGCGGGAEKPTVKVTGEFGQRPDVIFGKASAPTGKFSSSTLVGGKGAKVGDGDLVIANYLGYTWSKSGSSKLIGSSFQGSAPVAFPSWTLVPGLKRALTGSKVGSRVLAVIPPADGYGDKGSPRLQIAGDDSLVYVLDVVATYPKGASVKATKGLDEPGLPKVSVGAVPEITVPLGSPAPDKLVVRTVSEGSGAPVKGGQLLAIQYSGALWRTGKVFSSSWADGRVYAANIGVQQVIKAWDEALVGQKVGSRLMVVAPPELAYGAKEMKTKGLPKYGIKAKDTLVYVIDILGAY